MFIAGHRGLVGSSILALLQSQGYHNLITKTKEELNLLDGVSVEKFFAHTRPEYVFLAAAKVGGIVANNTYRADFIYENLAIQNHIIFNAYKYKVKKLLFLGSSCIYPKNAKQPMREYSLLTSELEYTNEPYAIAKIAGIKMCESFALQYGCDFVSVMPTNLYGNNDNFNLQTSHVLPALLRKIHLAKLLSLGKLEQVEKDVELQGAELQAFLQTYGITERSVAIWGSGNPRRELLHVNDMAEACVFVMQNLSFKDCITHHNEIRNTHLNVGYGSDISIAELSQLIKEIVGFEGELVFDTSKPDGTYQKLMDSSKLNALGWKPKIHLREGIQSVYQHYLSATSQKL
ncbi:GDP-L-fucose synthase family protein [Helicobacter cinaedi]|uniref:GDP-L-fucose synthase family protein n=1 Tax=Helicobacter cinaedi TaxID=213 RepID=UPI001F1CD2AE|nr:GDP-L-fucose synthase [Helicobacter cinaedi]